MKNVFCLLVISLLLLSSCGKDELNDMECVELTDALGQKDEIKLQSIFDDLCHDLKPEDSIGHEENVNTLMTRLETNCDVDAELLCYACDPSGFYSDIKVTVTSDSVFVRTLNFSTFAEGKISFRTISN